MPLQPNKQAQAKLDELLDVNDESSTLANQKKLDKLLNVDEPSSGSMDDLTYQSPGATAKEIQSFVEYGVGITDNVESMRRQRAENQSGWEQGRRAIGTGVTNGFLTFAENVGYLTDFEDMFAGVDAFDEEQGNWLSELATDAKDYMNEEFAIYQANPSKTWDFDDSGWVWSQIQGIIDSGVGFGLTGAAAGVLAASGVGTLGLGAVGTELATVFGASLMTNYAESRMMAFELYKDVYDKAISQGKTEEEANKMAATQSKKFVWDNKINIITNMVGMYSVFGKGYLTSGAGKKAFGTAARGFVAESLSEAYEEVSAGFLQKERLREAEKQLGVDLKDADDSYFKRALAYASSEEGLLEAALGVVGGPVQAGLSKGAKFATEKISGKEIGYDYSVGEEKILESLKSANDFSAAYAKAKADGDMAEAQRLQSVEFKNLAGDFFYHRKAEVLEKQLSEIASNEEKSKEDREAASKALTLLPQLQGEYESMLKQHHKKGARTINQIWKTKVARDNAKDRVDYFKASIAEKQAKLAEDVANYAGKPLSAIQQEEVILQAELEYLKQEYAAIEKSNMNTESFSAVKNKINAIEKQITANKEALSEEDRVETKDLQKSEHYEALIKDAVNKEDSWLESVLMNNIYSEQTDSKNQEKIQTQSFEDLTKKVNAATVDTIDDLLLKTEEANLSDKQKTELAKKITEKRDILKKQELDEITNKVETEVNTDQINSDLPPGYTQEMMDAMVDPSTFTNADTEHFDPYSNVPDSFWERDNELSTKTEAAQKGSPQQKRNQANVKKKSGDYKPKEFAPTSYETNNLSDIKGENDKFLSNINYVSKTDAAGRVKESIQADEPTGIANWAEDININKIGQRVEFIYEGDLQKLVDAVVRYKKDGNAQDELLISTAKIKIAAINNENQVIHDKLDNYPIYGYEDDASNEKKQQNKGKDELIQKRINIIQALSKGRAVTKITNVTKGKIHTIKEQRNPAVVFSKGGDIELAYSTGEEFIIDVVNKERNESSLLNNAIASRVPEGRVVATNDVIKYPNGEHSPLMLNASFLGKGKASIVMRVFDLLNRGYKLNGPEFLSDNPLSDLDVEGLTGAQILDLIVYQGDKSTSYPLNLELSKNGYNITFLHGKVPVTKSLKEVLGTPNLRDSLFNYLTNIRRSLDGKRMNKTFDDVEVQGRIANNFKWPGIGTVDVKSNYNDFLFNDGAYTTNAAFYNETLYTNPRLDYDINPGNWETITQDQLEHSFTSSSTESKETVLTEKEWLAFVDTGIASEDVIIHISNKIISGQALLPQEFAIREAYSAKIERLLKESITANFKDKPIPVTINRGVFKGRTAFALKNTEGKYVVDIDGVSKTYVSSSITEISSEKIEDNKVSEVKKKSEKAVNGLASKMSSKPLNPSDLMFGNEGVTSPYDNLTDPTKQTTKTAEKEIKKEHTDNAKESFNPMVSKAVTPVKGELSDEALDALLSSDFNDVKDVKSSAAGFKHSTTTQELDVAYDVAKEVERIRKIHSTIPVDLVKGLLQFEDGYADGMYYNHAITLSDVGTVGVGYHEAFHAITQGFLSPQQRVELYEKVYPSLSYLEAEEQLAEDFRAYMLHNEKPKNILQKIFEGIKSFIEYLTNPTKSKLFRDIRKGRYDHSPTYRSTQELQNRIGIPMSYQKELISSLRYMIVDIANNSGEDSLSLRESEVFDIVLKRLVQGYHQLNGVNQHKADNIKQAIKKFPLLKQLLKDDLASHNLQLKKDDMEADETEANEGLNIKSAIEVSNKENASTMTKLLVSTLAERDSNNEIKHGDNYGLPTISSFTKNWKILENALTGIIDDQNGFAKDKMLNKVLELSNEYPQFKDLHRKLTSDELSFNEKTQFYRAFSKQSVFYTTTLGKFLDGKYEVRIINSDSNNQGSQIKNEWSSKVNEKLYNEDGTIKDDTRRAIVLKTNELINKVDSLTDRQVADSIVVLYKALGVDITIQDVYSYIIAQSKKKKVSIKDLVTSKKAYSLTGPIIGKYSSLANEKAWDEEKSFINDNDTVFKQLSSIVAARGTVTSESTVIGPGGKQYWSKSENHYMVKRLAELRNDPDAVKKMLNSDWHRYSLFLGQINNAHEKSRDLDKFKTQVFLSNKIEDQNDAGSDYGELSPTDELSERFNRTMNGVYSPLTMADKSVWEQLEGFSIPDFNTVTEATDVLYNYFLAEWERIHSSEEGSDIANFKTAKNKFYLFGSLNKDKITVKDKDGNESTIDNPLRSNGKFVDNITEDREAFVKERISQALINRTKQDRQKMEDLGLIKDNRLRGLDNKVLHKYAANTSQMLMNFTAKSIISNIEFTMMFTGDPAFYKDLSKRTPETIATGIDLILDPQLPTHFNVGVVKSHKVSDAALIKNYTDALVKAGYSKEEAAQIVSPYDGLEEADAQAYITPKRFRDLKIMLGDWTNDHELAYNDMMAGLPVDISRLQMMQPMKGMHYQLKKQGDRMVPVYLKYSQAVLWPQLVKDTKLEQVLKNMTDNKLDELVFESGVKVGAQNQVSSVDVMEGPIEISSISLENKYWKLQQDLPSKYKKKGKALKASQVSKNILADLDLENDVYSLDGKDVNGNRIIEENNAVLSELSNISIQRLKDEWGITGDSSADWNKVYESLITKFKADGIDDNVIEALEKRAPFDSIPGLYEKIESTLLSSFTKKGVKLEINGGAFIQMSSYGMSKLEGKTLTELDDISGIKYFKDVTKLEGIKRDENGLVRAQVFLPHNALDDLKKHESAIFDIYKKPIDKLNGKELSEIFNGVLDGVIGYRIPNQGFSSIDTMEVVGILPSSVGDTIVTYQEVTAKTGSDFDIDKMYVMMHNLSFNRGTGKLERVKYLTESDPIEERYITKYKSLIDKKYKDSILEYRSVQNNIQKLRSESKKLIEQFKSQRGGEQLLTRLAIKDINDLISEEYNVLDELSEGGKLSNLYLDLLHVAASDGLIPSIEEFKELPITQQNTEKALQNRLIDVYDSILSSEHTYTKLITPLDSEWLNVDAYYLSVLKKNGAEVAKQFLDSTDKKKWLKENYDEFEDLEEFGVTNQMEVKIRNMAGKAGVGQTANHLTHHPLSQIARLMTTYDLGIGIPSVDENGEVTTSLHSIKNEKGQYITQIMSAWLNAYVDNAKDPYISLINNNTTTANTVFLMLRAGTDPKKVNRIVSQPIIVDYVNYIVNNNSKINKHYNKKRKPVTSQQLTETEGILSLSKPEKHFPSPLETMLDEKYPGWKKVFTDSYIELNKVTNEQLEEQMVSPDLHSQLAILKRFISLKHVGSELSELVKAQKPDTDGAKKNLQDAIETGKKLQPYHFSETFINHDKIMEEGTMLSTFDKNSRQLAVDVLSPKLLNGSASIKNTVDYVLSTFGIFDDFEGKNRKKITNELKTYLFSGAPIFSKTANDKKWLHDNIPLLVNKFKDLHKDNPLAQVLTVKYDKSTKPFTPYVTSLPGKLDKFDINSIWLTWEELMDNNEEMVPGTKYSNFAKTLIQYSFLTSGFQNKLDSFARFIPNTALNAHYSHLRDVTTGMAYNNEVMKEFVTQYARHHIEDLPVVKVDDMKSSVIEASTNIEFFRYGHFVYRKLKDVSSDSAMYQKHERLGSGSEAYSVYEYNRNPNPTSFKYPHLHADDAYDLSDDSIRYFSNNNVVTELKDNTIIVKGLEETPLTIKEVITEQEGKKVTGYQVFVNDKSFTNDIFVVEADVDVTEAKQAAFADATNSMNNMGFDLLKLTLNNKC